MNNTPTEAELKILRNLEAGRPFEHGFVHQRTAVQAMMQCLLNKWVSRGRLMPEGRAVLAAQKPTQGNYEITVVKEEKLKPVLLLPASSLLNPELRKDG